VSLPGVACVAACVLCLLAVGPELLVMGVLCTVSPVTSASQCPARVLALLRVLRCAGRVVLDHLFNVLYACVLCRCCVAFCVACELEGVHAVQERQ